MIGKRGLQHKLNVLRNPVCTACSLHKSTTNRCIMGRGNIDRPLLHLVGEAPGEMEAKTGQPFMGRAGNLLNTILKATKLTDKVYISNTCRCKPPVNRKPEPEEIDTCTDLYLSNEIPIIDAEVIVLLGRVPIDWYFGKRTDWKRGQVYPGWVPGMSGADRPRLFLPTWHPSYCLRTGPRSERELAEHIVAAKNAALQCRGKLEDVVHDLQNEYMGDPMFRAVVDELQEMIDGGGKEGQ